jgi:hypothetical protein
MSKFKKPKLAALVLLILSVGFTIFSWRAQKKEKVITMGPRWLLYSDEQLLKEFEDEAINGKFRVLRSNQILYDRFFLGRGDLSRAKPFLNMAAELGDETAREILKSPETYYLDSKKRFGESVPSGFSLK